MSAGQPIQNSPTSRRSKRKFGDEHEDTHTPDAHPVPLPHISPLSEPRRLEGTAVDTEWPASPADSDAPSSQPLFTLSSKRPRLSAAPHSYHAQRSTTHPRIRRVQSSPTATRAAAFSPALIIPRLRPLLDSRAIAQLDLDTIIRNPQLRHDLLYDVGRSVGIQFRPRLHSSGSYWEAVAVELESGCTCVSFNRQGQSIPTLCRCVGPPPPTEPVLFCTTPFDVVTIRCPSRLHILFTEFVEILISVMRPVARKAGASVQSAAQAEHAAQAAYFRSICDPLLIVQQIRCTTFDPSGLFTVIGQALKSHCAPMRDAAINEMVSLAQSCAPGKPGTTRTAVKVLRICTDILEAMKLDIVNHQLHTMRGTVLVETASVFELKALKRRTTTCHTTIDWLKTSHRKLLNGPKFTIPYPSISHYRDLYENQKITLSVLRGICDVVFSPPPVNAWPETLHLDTTRITAMSTLAAEAAIMVMFTTLFRILIGSPGGRPTSSSPSFSVDVARVKQTIRDLASSRLGSCLLSQDLMSSIVLQITRHAQEVRMRMIGEDPSTLAPGAVDLALLKVAESWASTNMKPDARLFVLLRARVRESVFAAVIKITYANRARVFQSKDLIIDAADVVCVGGTETIASEIRTLAMKASRMTIVHLHIWTGMYEQPGFFTP